MYKIIQSYNTFCYKGKPDSIREKAGFSTLRALVSYLKQSYKVHSKQDYKLYTDEAGVKNVDWMSKEHVEVIEFDEIDDRIPYTGKFNVHYMQKEPFIHVDLDATLFNVPTVSKDIITEKTRAVSFGRELKKVNVDATGLHSIICSGLIGFSDMEFKNRYVKKVYQKIKDIKLVHDIDHKACYTIEETLLTRMAKNENKSIYELNAEDYEHLQGNVK